MAVLGSMQVKLGALVIFLLVTGHHAIAANWMYLGVVGVTPLLPQGDQEYNNVSTSSAVSICQHLPGLVQQQIAVCQTHPDTIKSVSIGARLGIDECQYQFRNERWNCSTGPEDLPFGYTIKRGSKETAFVYAVTSAGVVHAVTRACSSGNLTDCSCDMSKQGMATPEGWKWGGCSDNLRFGVQFARQFVDAPEENNKKYKKFRKLMNLHNNEAGREVINRLMKMKCRCHGVSGSCELKTCWRSIPAFTEIGDYLKKKYDSSVQVTRKGTRHRNEKNVRIVTVRKSRRRKSRRRKRRSRRPRLPVRKVDLVHIHKSPNYCIPDIKRGILGTQGRYCNKTSHGPDSCDLLCCGRGYNTQVVQYVERCHCRFVWCCFVKCKTCVTNVDVHTCK